MKRWITTKKKCSILFNLRYLCKWWLILFNINLYLIQEDFVDKSNPFASFRQVLTIPATRTDNWRLRISRRLGTDPSTCPASQYTTAFRCIPTVWVPRRHLYRQRTTNCWCSHPFGTTCRWPDHRTRRWRLSGRYICRTIACRWIQTDRMWPISNSNQRLFGVVWNIIRR